MRITVTATTTSRENANTIMRFIESLPDYQRGTIVTSMVEGEDPPSDPNSIPIPVDGPQ